MTTLYVNKKLGIVITDTRTTTLTFNRLFGFEFNIRQEFNDSTKKSLYVHDRVFMVSGDCSESNKVLNYLINGEKIIPATRAQKLACNCLLVDKNWILQILTELGKVHKIFHIMSNDFWYSTGSGSSFLYKELKKVNFDPTYEEAIKAFESVSEKDPHTSSTVEIYKF